MQFTPEPDFVGTATPVRYQVDDTAGNAVASTYTPTVTAVTPIANPDYTSGPQGVAQSVDPLANDNAGNPGIALDASTLTLLDGAGNPTTSVDVPDQGTYTIADGKIVFTPVPSFTGAATPVTYRIADANGTTDTSTYTPQFDPVSPESSPDTTTGPQGAPQTRNLLANDAPGDAAVPLDASSVRLIDPATGNPATTVTIAGEGRYTLVDGTITFRPEPGFTGAGTRLSYTVADANGTITTSTYRATVTPGLVADTSTGPQGVAQSVDPLANDTAANLVPATLTLVDPDTGTATTNPVTIAGEGHLRDHRRPHRLHAREGFRRTGHPDRVPGGRRRRQHPGLDLHAVVRAGGSGSVARHDVRPARSRAVGQPAGQRRRGRPRRAARCLDIGVDRCRREADHLGRASRRGHVHDRGRSHRVHAAADVHRHGRSRHLSGGGRERGRRTQHVHADGPRPPRRPRIPIVRPDRRVWRSRSTRSPTTSPATLQFP